jgi:hypothetical protein
LKKFVLLCLCESEFALAEGGAARGIGVPDASEITNLHEAMRICMHAPSSQSAIVRRPTRLPGHPFFIFAKE